MAAVAVLHHDEPALQGFGMANSACRHLSCGCLKHLFHEHCAIGEMSVLVIGSDCPRRCIDDMKLLRTLALISRHRPASQRLIGMGTCKFPVASTTASAFGPLLGAVVPICPCAATTTIADSPAMPTPTRVMTLSLVHARRCRAFGVARLSNPS